HRHELGGNFDSGPPKVLSIASVPSKDGGSDDLYMLVKRTIDSTAVIYLERLRREFYENDLNQNSDDIYKQPIFTDCSKVLRTYQGNNVAAFYARLKSGIDADKAG